jgi:RNA polymerase sigma-70 factor, ECF subfamily
MSRNDELAATFLAARPRLVAIAYAILGSHAEAEDIVADTWFRLVRADATDTIRDVNGWAVVAVGRGALDAYRSARVRREVYVGPWLPEPHVQSPATSGPDDPADRVTLDEQVSFAMLVVLESLTPAERTSWVLHDLFGLPFAEVAAAVGRRPDAVRQLAARARAHLQAAAPRRSVEPGEHARVVTSFLQAAGGGDLSALVALLDPEVVLTSDGGGQVNAARRPVHGADRVARFVLGITEKGTDEEIRVVSVNGALGIGLFRGAELSGVVSLTLGAGRIARIDFVRAPDKLRHSSH